MNEKTTALEGPGVPPIILIIYMQSCMPCKVSMVSACEAVRLSVGASVDDVDSILTGGHENL